MSLDIVLKITSAVPVQNVLVISAIVKYFIQPNHNHLIPTSLLCYTDNNNSLSDTDQKILG